MNDFQRETLEYRKSIVDNSDKLIAHGHRFQKNRSVGQLSLFGTTDIEITRPDLTCEKLSDYQLEEMASKEQDAIGIPLLYDRYNRHILVEKTLCNATIEDVFYCTEERKQMVFMASLGDYNHRTSRSGNSYAKVFMVRNGYELKMYLSGELYRSTIGKLIKSEIYLIKCTYSNGALSIDKIQSANTIDVSKYIRRVVVDVSDCKGSELTNVRNYIFLNCKNNGEVSFTYSYKGRLYTELEHKISLTAEDCLRLIDWNAKVIINKEL